jgi:hypothetical protein
MTQILLYQSPQGILLATDSHAVTYSSQEDPQYIKVHKLFQLAPHVVLVTGGAGYGLPLCRDFQSYVKQRGLWDVEEIMHRALPFFRSELQRIHHKEPLAPIHPDLDRLYILLAGYRIGSLERPFRFLLLGSEYASDPLHVIKTSHVVAIPRQLSIEYHLSHLPPPEATMDKVETICKRFLVNLSHNSQDVGPPFHFVRITSEGIHIQTQKATISSSQEN